MPNGHEDDRHLTDTELGTTAAFPEVTGDGAVRELLTDTDLSTAITAQQARSIGISSATAAKLSALLQWALDQLEAANDRYTEDPSVERDVACISAHDLKHHDARMAGSRGLKAIKRFSCHINSRLKAN